MRKLLHGMPSCAADAFISPFLFRELEPKDSKPMVDSLTTKLNSVLGDLSSGDG